VRDDTAAHTLRWAAEFLQRENFHLYGGIAIFSQKEIHRWRCLYFGRQDKGRELCKGSWTHYPNTYATSQKACDGRDTLFCPMFIGHDEIWEDAKVGATPFIPL